MVNKLLVGCPGLNVFSDLFFFLQKIGIPKDHDDTTGRVNGHDSYQEESQVAVEHPEGIAGLSLFCCVCHSVCVSIA